VWRSDSFDISRPWGAELEVRGSNLAGAVITLDPLLSSLAVSRFCGDDSIRLENAWRYGAEFPIDTEL
jgi:hypothetical protein